MTSTNEMGLFALVTQHLADEHPVQPAPPAASEVTNERARDEFDKLVIYFRDEGHSRFGYEGDIMGLSPAEAAIKAMRALDRRLAGKADGAALASTRGGQGMGERAVFVGPYVASRPDLNAADAARNAALQRDPNDQISALAAAVDAAFAVRDATTPPSDPSAREALAALRWTDMPSYGEIDCRQLREAVAEATVGDRRHVRDTPEGRYIGHDMTDINFNSLNRIVSAFVRAALSPAPDPAALRADGSCDDCPPVDYPTDRTRCLPCPRRTPDPAASAQPEGA